MTLLGFSKTSRSASWLCTTMGPPVTPSIQKVISYSSLLGCGDFDAGLLTAKLHDSARGSKPPLPQVHEFLSQVGGISLKIPSGCSGSRAFPQIPSLRSIAKEAPAARWKASLQKGVIISVVRETTSIIHCRLPRPLKQELCDN